jgi:hypothetical protein
MTSRAASTSVRTAVRMSPAVIDPSNKPARSTRPARLVSSGATFEGARLHILEIPPLIWVPAMLIFLGIVLGWIALVT